MIPLTPSPNLTDQVYGRILEAITDRTLPPGRRITQNELAERLGVSRQPVSHALHLLHRQGLLAESGRRGFEVTQLDPENPARHLELAVLAEGLGQAEVGGRAFLRAAQLPCRPAAGGDEAAAAERRRDRREMGDGAGPRRALEPVLIEEGSERGMVELDLPEDPEQ